MEYTTIITIYSPYLLSFFAKEGRKRSNKKCVASSTLRAAGQGGNNDVSYPRNGNKKRGGASSTQAESSVQS